LYEAIVVDDTIRFVYDTSKEKIKSFSSDSNGDDKESNEPDYDEDQLKEQEEETGEINDATINQVF
jgi:hypothetical protein